MDIYKIMKIGIKRYNNNVWFQYNLEGTLIFEISRDLKRVRVRGQKQQSDRGSFYTPHETALRIIDFIYEKKLFIGMELEQEDEEVNGNVMTEGQESITSRVVLTSHSLGFAHELPKPRFRPRKST